MITEYEATFPNINKDQVRQQLKNARARLLKPEFVQKRVVFNLPQGQDNPDAWLRVRDEGDQITMSLKIVHDGKIEDQKEIMFKLPDFHQAVEFLTLIGCQRKSFQETKRELWRLDNVDITIDEWPFLEPFVEIEGESADSVKSVAQKLGFDYSQAIFSAVDYLYSQKYGLPKTVINNQPPQITFSMPNPFLEHQINELKSTKSL